MKKRTKLFLTLMVTPLALASCSSTDKAIEVPYNLDYLYKTTASENIKEDYFPKKLSTNDVLMMMETKQDFVLYFYQDLCPACSELASPKIKKFLSNPETAFNIFAYDARTFDANLLYDDEKLSKIFNETPKIMFFRDGEQYMTLSQKRYTDYNLFSSAMSSFIKTTNIYTATKEIAIDTFLEKHDNYLLYFNADIVTNKETSKKPSFKFYKDNIFPIMKNASIPTLVVSNYELNSEYKTKLYEKFDLNPHTQTWAVLSNQTIIEKFNYLNVTESQVLINHLNQIN